ncbi:BspA family leucine-rich repeat surface protein [Streptobacillus felis]|uniref:BspA family leucine-rich repeat surface protein n=1 Tax=Streptobacillus felis TaxID=1384509 RepID=UPI00082C90BE|nr:BspA family leucine-rich repeat surface protein [Streptobacillus felis]
MNNFIYKPNNKEELIELINNENIFLGDIDTSEIYDMSNLFYESKRENFKGIEKWDVSNVQDMEGMFKNSNFNGDISGWDTSNVQYMSEMFSYSDFNGDISSWDVSNVEDMEGMFKNSKFNGDISKWDVSNVYDFCSMFYGSDFNQNINEWEINPNAEFAYIFEESKFNQPLDKWIEKTGYFKFYSNELINNFDLKEYVMKNIPDSFSPEGYYKTEIYDVDEKILKNFIRDDYNLLYLAEDNIFNKDEFENTVLKDVYEHLFTNEYNVYGLEEMLEKFKNAVGVDTYNLSLIRAGVVDSKDNHDKSIVVNDISKIMDKGFSVGVDLERAKEDFRECFDTFYQINKIKTNGWNKKQDQSKDFER